MGNNVNDSPPISDKWANAIWDVLKHVAGASEYWREHFVQKQAKGCGEFRFGGTLGFGGKFRNYNDRWYVDCYPEDITDWREKTIDEVNVKLSLLRAQAGASGAV